MKNDLSSFLQKKASAFAKAAEQETLSEQLSVLQNFLRENTDVEYCAVIFLEKDGPRICLPSRPDALWSEWVQHFALTACQNDFFDRLTCVYAIAELLETFSSKFSYQGIEQIVCEVRAQKQILVMAQSAKSAEKTTSAEAQSIIQDMQTFMWHATHGKTLFQKEETVENFLAMAHELKNPLQIILSATQAIENVTASTDASVRKQVGELALYQKRNVWSSIRRIDNMMDVLRLETGRVAMESALCKLEDILSETVKEAALYAQRDGVELTFVNETARAALLVCNKIQMERIVANLLSNAVKACRAKKGGTITLVLQETEADFVIRVEDTGCGMSPEALRHIGESFYRAPSAYGNEKGAGLGVYLVKKTLETFGASLSYESEENKGTTAIVKIPRRIGAAQNTQALHAAAGSYDAGELQLLMHMEFAEMYL